MNRRTFLRAAAAAVAIAPVLPLLPAPAPVDYERYGLGLALLQGPTIEWLDQDGDVLKYQDGAYIAHYRWTYELRVEPIRARLLAESRAVVG